MAALEHGEAARVFGSGMAAISTVMFAHVKPGDHAVFQADIYGGTFLFVQELMRFGVAVSFVKTPEDAASQLRPDTRVVYVESPSNPLLRVAQRVRRGRRRTGGEQGIEEPQRACTTTVGVPGHPSGPAGRPRCDSPQFGLGCVEVIYHPAAKGLHVCS